MFLYDDSIIACVKYSYLIYDLFTSTLLWVVFFIGASKMIFYFLEAHVFLMKQFLYKY